MIYTCKIDTPLGDMVASAEEGALTGLWFVGQKYFPSKTDTWACRPDYTVFEELRVWLSGYFLRRFSKPGLKLDPHGTAFQKAVWNILLEIPPGKTLTYGEIAKRLASRQGLSSMSAQAVGGAVGHNPISILIPCHRVIGSGGSLTGYAGGLDKKMYLLKLEQKE